MSIPKDPRGSDRDLQRSTPGGWIRCPRALLLDRASVVAGASVVASVIRKNLDLDPGRLGIEPIPGIEPTVMKMTFVRAWFFTIVL